MSFILDEVLDESRFYQMVQNQCMKHHNQADAEILNYFKDLGRKVKISHLEIKRRGKNLY